VSRFWIYDYSPRNEVERDLRFWIKKHTSITLHTSHPISHIPHSTFHIPHLPLAFILLIIFSLLTACGGDTNAAPVPPQIHYGEDVCEFCGMIVSEERFAGGYTTSDGQQHIFDDIGDMVQAYLQNGGNIAAAFVHDYNDHTWIKAETAYYVQNKDFPTPMLSGIAAFTKQEQANAFANEQGGNVFNFEEMLAEYR